jgi:hypothetical protein
VALDAERGEIVDAIQMPSSARRIPSMMNFRAYRGVAQAAAVPVALQGPVPKSSPQRRCHVLLVAHPYLARSRHPAASPRYVVAGQSRIKQAVNQGLAAE